MGAQPLIIIYLIYTGFAVMMSLACGRHPKLRQPKGTLIPSVLSQDPGSYSTTALVSLHFCGHKKGKLHSFLPKYISCTDNYNLIHVCILILHINARIDTTLQILSVVANAY